MPSQVYVRAWRLSWTAVNLLTLCMLNKSHYLLGSSFIHFLICEWNDSYNVAYYRCELKIQTVWDIVHKTNRFNRKKLHVPPRTVGITADCVQYHDTYRNVQGVLIIGLCLLSGLSESDYSWYVLDPGRDMRFFSSLKSPDGMWDHPVSYSKGGGILPWR